MPNIAFSPIQGEVIFRTNGREITASELIELRDGLRVQEAERQRMPLMAAAAVAVGVSSRPVARRALFMPWRLLRG